MPQEKPKFLTENTWKIVLTSAVVSVTTSILVSMGLAQKTVSIWNLIILIFVAALVAGCVAMMIEVLYFGYKKVERFCNWLENRPVYKKCQRRYRNWYKCSKLAQLILEKPR